VHVLLVLWATPASLPLHARQLNLTGGRLSTRLVGLRALKGVTSPHYTDESARRSLALRAPSALSPAPGISLSQKSRKPSFVTMLDGTIVLTRQVGINVTRDTSYLDSIVVTRIHCMDFNSQNAA